MPGSSATKAFGGPDGRFVLEVRGEGTYVLELSPPNRALATVSGVNVVPGQTVDVGRVRLAAGGTVRGQVVDTSGAPVAGATVSVRGPGREMGFGMAPQGTSDPSGSFEVRGIPAGTVEAVALHPAYAEARASGIEVDPAKEPAETRIVMTRGGRIEGSVRRRDGSGIAGTVVTLWPATGLLSRPPQQPTADDGGFSFDHVAPGRVRVVLMSGSGGMMTSVQTREVDVTEGETTLVEMVSRDILLSGRVTRNGQPAPGLRLRLMGTSFTVVMGMGASESGPPRGPQRMTAATGADGHYEMIVNESGKYRLSVDSVDGRSSYPSRMVEIPDTDAHALDLSFTGAQLTGSVVDKDNGQPIADARLAAMPKKPGPVMGVGNATTNAEGRFQLNLEPGDYRLDARAQGYAPATLDVVLDASGASDLRVSLARGVALEGRVVDEYGRGVGGLQVFAAMPPAAGGAPNPLPGSIGSDNTQADGSFVIDGLQQRPHLITARSAVGSFAILAGVSPGDRDVVLTLRPGGRVIVRAFGPDGAPLAGAYARITTVDGVQVFSLGGVSGAQTDARGVAELQLPAGSLEIQVSKEKLRGEVKIALPERGAVGAEVTLSEARPVRKLP